MSSTVLVRLSQSEDRLRSGLTPLQTRMDGLVSRFTEEATNPQTLASLAGSSLAYRYARLGALSLASSQEGWVAPLLRFGSYGVGLGVEAGIYEGIHRSITTLKGDHSNPQIWNWKGSGGIGQGIATSALTFGILKSAGYLGREQNLFFQHALQSTAMVAGHQMAASAGLIPTPEGSLGEQLLNAEIINLQLGSALGLLSKVAPGLQAVERGLDLSIQSKERASPNFSLAVMVEANMGEKISVSGKEGSLWMSKGDGESQGTKLELIFGGAFGRTEEREIQELFSKTAASTSLPRFQQTLKILARFQEKNSIESGASERDLLMQRALGDLEGTIREELPHLTRSEWTTLAVGFFFFGSKILREGSEGNRVGRFCRILADFVRHTQAHPDFENDPEHFFRDRLLSQTLVSLKGFLNDQALDPTQKTALAALFVRMGIARGSVEWSKLGVELPQVDEALLELLGITRAQVRKTHLMVSRSYFQMAQDWRGLPLGPLEYSLAYYLDHWRADHREAKAGAFDFFPEHEAITRLRQDLSVTPLNEEARLIALQRIIDLAALHSAGSLASTPLAMFLKQAMEFPSSGPPSLRGSGTEKKDDPTGPKSSAKTQRFTLEGKGSGVPVTFFANDRIPLSPMALRQAQGMAALPGVVRALGMPDLHAGETVPNGFVLATKSTIVPGAVGRDINCGMRLYRTGLNRQSTNLRELIENIASRIQLGKRWGSLPVTEDEVGQVLQNGVKGLREISNDSRSKNPAWELISPEYLNREIPRIEEEGALPGDLNSVARSHRQMGKTQLGTVGDGNHFLEFQVVDEILNPEAAAAMGISRGDILMMIHTGSRGLGHSVGTQYMHIAKSLAKGAASPVKDIYSIPAESPEGVNYFTAMNAAANYAFANRLLLGALATRSILDLYPDAKVDLIYDVAHNIIKLENHEEGPLFVHRKGATRAFPPSRMQGTPFAELGQPVLIPGSMGTASYLLVGNEGSEASLHSVNHGAGRVMKRSEALQRRESKKGRKDRLDGEAEVFPDAISDREFRKAMRGIELLYHDGRRIKGEAPQVYKDINDVMAVVFAEGLATGVARLKPIAVIKE